MRANGGGWRCHRGTRRWLYWGGDADGEGPFLRAAARACGWGAMGELAAAGAGGGFAGVAAAGGGFSGVATLGGVAAVAS